MMNVLNKHLFLIFVTTLQLSKCFPEHGIWLHQNPISKRITFHKFIGGVLFDKFIQALLSALRVFQTCLFRSSNNFTLRLESISEGDLMNSTIPCSTQGAKLSQIFIFKSVWRILFFRMKNRIVLLLDAEGIKKRIVSTGPHPYIENAESIPWADLSMLVISKI